MDIEFPIWLSECLKTNMEETRKILANQPFKYFLIAWSIYEAKCFGGSVSKGKMKVFVDNVESSIKPEKIDDIAKYFHQRYQNDDNYRHLIYKNNKDGSFDQIIKKEYKDLTINDKIYLLVFVTYRYRNNIYHGNKGISAWLKFEDQIKKCVQVLQLLIDASPATPGKPFHN